MGCQGDKQTQFVKVKIKNLSEFEAHISMAKYRLKHFR